jgi:hypothetical protein
MTNCLQDTSTSGKPPNDSNVSRASLQTTPFIWNDVAALGWKYRAYLIQAKKPTVTGTLVFRFIGCGAEESGFHTITLSDSAFVHEKDPSLIPDDQDIAAGNDVGVITLNLKHRPADMTDDTAWKALVDDAADPKFDLGQGKWPRGAELDWLRLIERATRLIDLLRDKVPPLDPHFDEFRRLEQELRSL